MKKITAISMAAILALAVTVTNITPAEATKADTSQKLSPKSFGPKTAYKVNIEKTYDKDPLKNKMGFKSEELKSKLKMLEAKKAAELLRKL